MTSQGHNNIVSETTDTTVNHVIVDKDTGEMLSGGIFKGELVFRSESGANWRSEESARSVIDTIVESGRDEGRRLGVNSITKVTVTTVRRVS